MTLAQLSRASGVREGSIKRLEEGRLDPGFDLLVRLTEGIGARPSELIIHAEALARDEPAPPDA